MYISVPNSYTDAQRQGILDAGRLARLDVHLCNEMTAITNAYFTKLKKSHPSKAINPDVAYRVAFLHIETHHTSF